MRSLAALLGMLAIAVVAAVSAQEGASESAPGPVPPAAGGTPTVEVFVPSEKISADASVSFPVDI